MKTLPGFTLVLFFLLPMQNQNLGMVWGDVLDMRGKPIAEALVVYTNTANHKTYSAKTDALGKFKIIGLILGEYDVKITRSSGHQIYTGHKRVYAIDRQGMNAIEVDLSLIPTKASLAPFLGVKADELQKEPWRTLGDDTTRRLTPEQRAELKKENELVADYNSLTPETQEAIKAQDWQQAATLLQQLIKIAPYKWELYQNLGLILRNLGRFDEAVKSFETGIQVAPASQELKRDDARMNAAIAQMQISEGEALLALDKLGAAAAQFRSAARLDPKPAIAYLHLCATEYNSGHGDAAIAACSHALEAEPGRTESYQVLGGVESNLEHYHDALAAYEKGIAVAQDNVSASRPSPKSNINSRQFSDPTRALAEQTRAGQMMQSAGNIYFLLKKYDKAAEMFRQAAGLHPYPALPLFNLCAALYNMNRFSAAASACDRAIEADAKMPDPYFVKASALYGEAAKQGKRRAPHEAAAALEKYLQLAPEGPYAGDARAMLQER
ncbi:MAG TPA: tetratricopeptide repeat protein [Candidatus Angelobacter sp.]|jgi:tetratricopeptide (TPR) repeat protein